MANTDESLSQPFSLFPPAPARVDRTEWDTTTSTPGKSTERATMGPEMAAAQQQRDAALKQTVSVADQKLEYDKKVAGINADKAADELKLQDKLAKTKTDAEALYKPDLDKMSAEVARAHADYQKYEAPKLFANRDGWGDALLAVGLAMGAFGGAFRAKAAAKLGQISHDDPAGDIIRLDLDRQREAIKHLTDKELSAKTGFKDRRDALAVELAKIDARGAEMYKRIAGFASQRLTNMGADAATIDRNETVAKANEAAAAAQTSAVQGLTNRVTEHEATVTKHAGGGTTLNDATNTKAPQLPTKITDQLSGSDLPIDPTRTDPRKHNQAVGKLPPINTFIDTSRELIDKYAKNGPGMPQAISGIVGGGTEDAEAKAAVTRLRSAYAAAKGESIGEGNAKHLESAIPDPPSSMSTPGQRANWLAKIHEVTREMEQLRSENLANAGVPPADIARAKRAPGQAPGHTPATPTTTPVTAAAPAPSVGPPAPVVVRTGRKADGTKVEQLSDGTIREVR